MPNSIDFYRGIFLHVIPVCIIVPCSDILHGFLSPFLDVTRMSQGPNLETKVASQKNLRVARKIACRKLKHFWVL